jgi:acyl carrier protein
MSTAVTPTEQELQAMAARRLEVEPSQVDLDARLLGDLGLDSFDLIGVVLEIETAFHPVSVANKSAEEIKTLRELAAYIDEELARAPATEDRRRAKQLRLTTDT